MARILHLEDNSAAREKFRVAVADFFEVIACSSVQEAEAVQGKIDLYVCGTLGKHSDGLLFALEMRHAGRSVLILADRRKFSKMPFLGLRSLDNVPEVRRTIGMMTGRSQLLS